MNRIVSFFPFAVIALAGLFWTACNTVEETAEESYLTVDSQFRSASGEGDGFLLLIRSNLAWTVSAEDPFGNIVDWVKFECESGEGDADVFGFVQRGDRTEARTCLFVVRSTDGRQKVTFPFSQLKYEPNFRKVSLSSIMSSAASLPAGGSDLLTDFLMFEAIVVGAPGDNLPEGGVFLTDDGNLFLRAKLPDSEALKVGDKIQIETTEGTVTKEAGGGITIDIPSPVMLVSSGNRIQAPRIQASAVARYPNALVRLEPSQAQDAFLGKTWSGTVGMVTDDEDAGKFDVFVDGGASFSKAAIPSGHGTVTGIVVDGKVRPRDLSDLALSETGRNSYVPPVAIEPIMAFFQLGTAANKYVNGEISGATKFTFAESAGFSVAGASVEKVVGDANAMAMTASLSTPFQTCCTLRQWQLPGSYLLFTLPVTGKIYGNLEFTFSISCGTEGVFNDFWKVRWSTDKVTWKDVDGVYGASNLTPRSGDSGTFTLAGRDFAINRMVVQFHIPENEALTSGDLYFRMDPPAVDEANATKTLRVNVGFYLTGATPSLPDSDYHNVLAQEGFNNALNGCNPVVGIPIYYMSRTINQSDYSGDWTVSGTANQYLGCLFMSGTDGTTSIYSPPLAALTATSDVILSFKAAPYVNPTGKVLTPAANTISVVCEGAGEAGPIEWDNADFASDPYHWHRATVKISGATGATRIRIGNATSEFFIDDIIISR